MADLNELFGSCACERNRYTVIIPSSSASLAQVFFDNSAANLRSQATPVTAWLRVPLDWYHSTTYAQFPDESHNSIRRTFNTPQARADVPPTRRQFCGYCGTHLTVWNEGHSHSADYLDVTLGSLLGESIDRLEALNIIPENTDDEDVLAEGGGVNEDNDVSTNDARMSGTEGLVASASETEPISQQLSRGMQNRGMPYFEEMVENSRLGRIKRQKGGHTSSDGRTTVNWEVVEIGGDESMPAETQTETNATPSRSKRQKMDG